MSLKEITEGDRPVLAPNFVAILENLVENPKGTIHDLKAVMEEIFLVAAERSFDDNEFSLLMHLFCKGPITSTTKVKLLPSIVPAVVTPYDSMKKFMMWFLSNYSKMDERVAGCIMQWLVGLLDNDLITSEILDIFYYDLFKMLEFQKMKVYACKLLCKLTRPDDVKASSIRVVSRVLESFERNEEKYLTAVLTVFKGYKPHLMTGNTLKKINVEDILSKVPQKMDFFMKLANRRQRPALTRGPGVFEVPVVHPDRPQECPYNVSSLIPFPTYDQKVAGLVYPRSIKEAFNKFTRVPIPRNPLSLLRDEVGFFTLMFKGTDLQMQFSMSLMHTLQDVFIYQEKESNEEAKDFLLKRIYRLEMFMVQGVESVSMFLAGYLLNWDGLDHRFHILNLIEWAVFDSYRDLYTNVLRPLYMLFVTYNVTMKQQIIQTVTNLIKNMFTAEIGRLQRNLPHPFLKRVPAWASDPLAMLTPLVSWVESLIKVGLCQEPDSVSFLSHCISFYEMMNELEGRWSVPMWTVVSSGVVYRSLFIISPIALGFMCRLLLRYYTEFLPKMRAERPDFYAMCKEKINQTTKYIRDIINLLWNGQAFARSEDESISKKILEEVQQSNPHIVTSFDTLFEIIFLPFIELERNKHGPGFVRNKTDYLVVLDYYAEDISAFIRYFESQ